MIDLRSDTVTRPTPAMLAAMVAAPVGDDVYGEDPTVNRLEARVAELLGKEAAIYVPSGTMSNQIAVRLHCRPGEEILAARTSHLLLWEGGAPAALSGVTVRPLDGEYGILGVNDFRDQLAPADNHSPQTRLIWLENTHNRGGGRVHPFDSVAAIAAFAREAGIPLHLDGARLWNAAVATGISPAAWAEPFATVSVCFSKGLGAPVGSALAGSREQITLARRYRKLFGGAMRQAGFLAAACLHALEHHVERLADDHANARLLADAVASTPGLTLDPAEVHTNVVWFRVDPHLGTPKQVAESLKMTGVLVAALGHDMVRLVTHLDVSRADCEKAAKAIRTLVTPAH
jgi:threonine aldolase